MRQVLFTIPIFGGIKVFGYGAMLVLAFVGSTWIATWRARREKLDPEVILDMAFWIFFIGLIGARLFYCIQYWGEDINSLLDVIQYWKGGIVYYGGILGGALAFFVYRHFRPFPLRPYLDVMAPAIMVGTLFGRLGCFLNGCCYGDVCNLPWAVRSPSPRLPGTTNGSTGLIPADAAQSLPLHPTQLYSSLDALVILILLSAYLSAPPPRRRGHGPSHGHLSDHPIPDRVSPQRRGGLLRRADHLPEHQHSLAHGRTDVLVMAVAISASSIRRQCTRVRSPGPV